MLVLLGQLQLLGSSVLCRQGPGPARLSLLVPGAAVHGGAPGPADPPHHWREAAPGSAQHAGKSHQCHERVLPARALLQHQGVCREKGGPSAPCPVTSWLPRWQLRGCGQHQLLLPQVKEWVAQLMKTLRDPALPLLELQEIMTSISGRIPPSVEKSIWKVMAQYASNITSVLCRFPSQQVSGCHCALARAWRGLLPPFVLLRHTTENQRSEGNGRVSLFTFICHLLFSTWRKKNPVQKALCVAAPAPEKLGRWQPCGHAGPELHRTLWFSLERRKLRGEPSWL